MKDPRMQEVSDTMLMALADGELGEPTASELRSMIRTDPALAARYMIFVDTAAAVKAAADLGPVPGWLADHIRNTPTGTRATSTMIPSRRRTILPAGWPTALAASVVLAVAVGAFTAGRLAAPMSTGDASVSLAAAQALSRTTTAESVALSDGTTARVMGSFDTDLGLCRLISTQDPSGVAGRAVACRTDGVWQITLYVASGDTDLFLPASEAAVTLVDDFLDGINAGSLLNPAEEAAALANGE